MNTFGPVRLRDAKALLSAEHLETLRAVRTNAELELRHALHLHPDGAPCACVAPHDPPSPVAAFDERIVDELRALGLIERASHFGFYTLNDRGKELLALADRVEALAPREQTQLRKLEPWTRELLTFAMTREWYTRGSGGFVARIGSVRVVTRRDENAFANDRIVVDVLEGDTTLTVNAACARALAASLLRAAALAELEIATADGGS